MSAIAICSMEGEMSAVCKKGGGMFEREMSRGIKCPFPDI